MKQGVYLTPQMIERIVELLFTELTVAEIAERCSCTRHTVTRINKRFKIRDYFRRSQWKFYPKEGESGDKWNG